MVATEMTVYKNTDGVVVGQPMSPFFGAQNGQQGPGAITVQQPTTAPTAGGMQATGVQMSMLEQCSRGIIPRNANLATVAGQAVSAGVSQSQGDGLSIDEAFACGNGAEVCLGAPVAPNAGNTSVVTLSTLSQQAFVDGIAGVGDALSTGPAATNVESVVSAPMAHTTTTANVTLLAGVYAG
jgi:hypothetical protein